MEAQILQQQHLAGFKLTGHFTGHFADAIRRKGHVDALAQLLVEQFTQTDNHRAQRVLRIRLALGTAQVRGKNHLGLAPQGVLDGGQSGHYTGVIRDGRAVFGQRNVEINADEQLLVGQIDVANRELGHGNGLP